MADTTTESPSHVTAGIRLLTSSSMQETHAKATQNFEGILLNKLNVFKSALLSEENNFDNLRRRLQNNKSCDFWRDFLTEKLDSPENNEQIYEITREHRDLNSWKLKIRWKFVETCLRLLEELQCVLGELVTKKTSCKETTTSKADKRPTNPKLNVDALSLSDQKVVLTCVQFIVSLGIYPNLLPGVGIPVEKRSGFFQLIKGTQESRNERHLYECVCTLVDSVKHLSLGSLILSRHLGDMLTALIQVCFAPTSSYDSDGNVSEQQPISAESSNACVRNDKELTPPSLSPGNVMNIPIKGHNLISASQRENSLLDLQQLLERVYQPMVIRELLMIQGAAGQRKQPSKKTNGKTTDSSGRTEGEQSVSGDGTKTGLPNYPVTPKWFRDTCGQLLSARLMKPNGVQAVLRGVLGAPGDPSSIQDWRKCDMVAMVIANCPSQAGSVEEYYAHIAPQVLGLLHISHAELGQQFVRVASSTVSTMLKHNPGLAKKHLLHTMLAPLLAVTQCTEHVSEIGSMVCDEAALTQCVEDVHKVFVAGSDPQCSVLLSSVVHPVFELFCFTRNGVSHLRSFCQEIIVLFLKHVETSLALKTLYVFAYRDLPPSTFGLSLERREENSHGYDSNHSAAEQGAALNNNGKLLKDSFNQPLSTVTADGRSHDTTTTEIPIRLMRSQYVFGHGDGGGIIIRSCDSQSSASCGDVLGRLTGDAMMSYEVQALCLVELLVGLEKDGLSGEFFLHLMRELTNIVSQEEEIKMSADKLEDPHVYDKLAKAHEQSLLILHLVGLMCDKLGPSMLKDVYQMLAFVKSTLQRGCVLCEANDVLLEGGYVSETLTLAFGMLSAIMGGSAKVEKHEQSSLQELVPYLETLSRKHPSTEVKEMANDLRIAIATHGVVWSQQMKHAAGNLGKNSDNSSESSTDDVKYDEAFSELCDPLVPIRGHAILTLAKLLRKRHPKAVLQTDALLKIFTDQLSHDDSYIYLAAIQGLVALSSIKTDQVLPHLARAYAACRREAGLDRNEETQNLKKKSTNLRLPEVKMKLGEALVKAVKECGDLVPRYSQYLMSSLLCGVKDPDEFVRASSLSNIGEICKLLRFSVGPIIHEVFSCLHSVLSTDKSDPVRRAAVLVITLLLQGLHRDAIQVLSDNLRDIYHLLKIVAACDKDDMTRTHARAALGELDAIMREFLFPQQTFSKRIHVLP